MIEQLSMDLTTILKAGEDARRAALVADDIAGLAALLADGLIHVHTTGVRHGKEALLEHVGSFLRFYAVERGSLEIVPVGPDAAIMTGEMTNLVGRRGSDERITVRSFVTQVWVCQGSWKILHFHATRLPEQAS